MAEQQAALQYPSQLLPLVPYTTEDERLPHHEMRPLGLLPLNTLGEPDPANITK